MRSTHTLRALASFVMTTAALASRAQTAGAFVGVATDAATGKAVPRVEVVVTSPSLQGAVRATTDDRGEYRLELLPPGVYSVEARAEGYFAAVLEGARLDADELLRLNVVLTPTTAVLDEAIVTTATPPAVNVGSAQTGVVVPSAFVESVPIAQRRFDAAALVAPTAHADRYGFGFGGAQSPEHRYWIDGLDVTDPRRGINAVPLVPQFVQQVDVKTGSYAAEYGRATGGIVSAVTKSGSNELHGSVFSSLEWRPPQDPVGRLGEAIWIRKGAPGSFDLHTGLELGGPIARDRLWFHVGLAPTLAIDVRERFLRANVFPEDGSCPAGSSPDAATRICKDALGTFLQTDLPGTTRRYRDETTTWQFHAKLTWRPTEDQTASLAMFGTPNTHAAYEDFLRNAAPYLHGQEFADEILDVVGRWSGRFLDGRVIVETLAGYHRHDAWDTSSGEVDGVNLYETPGIAWRLPLPLGTFEDVPEECDDSRLRCPVRAYRTGGWGQLQDVPVDRVSARVSVGGFADALGPHHLKAGVDVERTTAALDRAHLMPVFAYFPNLTVVGLPPGPGFVTPNAVGRIDRDPETGREALELDRSLRSSAVSLSPAVFVQDSWRVVPNVMLNAGLRWEWQYMDRGEARLPHSRIAIDDNVASRLEAIWDPSGRGRSKISAAWGRFYEGIPLQAGVRALGGGWAGVAAALDASACSGFTGPSAAPFDPLTCPAAAPLARSDSVTPVAPDLRGQFVDQFAASAEYEPLTDVSVGLTYEGRRLGRVIEDLSSDEGAHYFIANPGASRPFIADGAEYDARGMLAVDPATGRSYVAPFPRPERSYDALTVRLSKAYARRWLAEASYTWSSLRGNYQGLFRPEDGQLDPNITAEYDLPSLMPNRHGPLPADRAHAVKVHGAYRWDATSRLALTIGGAGSVFSGTPVNALAAHPFYGLDQSFLIPRGMGGRTPWVSQLDVRLAAEWALSPRYAVRAAIDVYNVLDARTPTAMDESWTIDVVQPIGGIRCDENAVAEDDPVAALLAACPELAYLKTIDGHPATVSPNWGRPREHQLPRATRLSLALSF